MTGHPGPGDAHPDSGSLGLWQPVHVWLPGEENDEYRNLSQRGTRQAAVARDAREHGDRLPGLPGPGRHVNSTKGLSTDVRKQQNKQIKKLLRCSHDHNRAGHI
jgi:hypothetical protein